MSHTTALGIVPGQIPVFLGEFRNAHGWSPSIWRRLCEVNDLPTNGMFNDDPGLEVLWATIETQPEWQQIPNVLTFDTGVIPFQEYERAADMLDEFERRCPAPEGHANHVPAVAALLRSKPEVPFFGIHGTSVSENPFKLWIPDEDDEDEGTYRGLSIDEFYVLGRHGKHLPKEFR